MYGFYPRMYMKSFIGGGKLKSVALFIFYMGALPCATFFMGSHRLGN